MSELKYKELELGIDNNGFFGVINDTKELGNNIFSNITWWHKLHILPVDEVLPEDVMEQYRNDGYDFEYSNVRLPNTSIPKGKYSYGYFGQSVIINQFYNKAMNELTKSGAKEVDYVAVEEDEVDNHIVRGLIRLGSDGRLSVTINPEHQKRMDYYNNDSFSDSVINFFVTDDDPYLLTKSQNKINKYLQRAELAKVIDEYYDFQK